MRVDFHTHIFSSKVKNNRRKYIAKDVAFEKLYSKEDAKIITAEELISIMDQKRINCSVVMGIGWHSLDAAKESNDYIIEACRKFKGRLIGLGSVNPILGEDAIKELNRCLDNGLIGMGELHPDLQQFQLDDFNIMKDFMEQLDHKNRLLVTHSSEPVGHLYTGKGCTTPDKTWNFINMFPNSNVIFAHWGGGLPFYAMMPEVCKGISNFYFDTAASPYLYDKSIFKFVCELIGSNRILFGSDYPVISQTKIINQIIDSNIPSESKEKILSINAIELLAKLKVVKRKDIFKFNDKGR